MPINAMPFTILESVDSTNNYAMQKVHSGLAKNGDAWFALEQTNGKGRRGRQWVTTKGENIILTIVADTLWLQMQQQFQLTVAVALACYDLFSRFDNNNTKIKWPNDLFWGDRKAGGILIENIIKGNIWQWSVIGIGINVNQTVFEQVSNRAVSLKQISGQSYDPIELGRELYKTVLTRLNELRSNNFEKMLANYNAVLYKRNEAVRLKKQNAVFETIINGVSSFGQLLTVDVIERSFDFDEIEWTW